MAVNLDRITVVPPDGETLDQPASVWMLRVAGNTARGCFFDVANNTNASGGYNVRGGPALPINISGNYQGDAPTTGTVYVTVWAELIGT